jgi:hypothetical protein
MLFKPGLATYGLFFFFDGGTKDWIQALQLLDRLSTTW